ncbi:TPR-like protein [Coniophora puteana RWD-64-598 SS2]|uniref:TPR-like protein n=1 Tax=Coniophora puteana (strain RWD-64-598) TaxID=741705 RepID=A0A5M3M7T6_CONPW|nr:TPR-like protein [Coniophora puteana RWD-64-598 SS2]EIW75107.1 TPR-like protein [Coniophora puteana RWD-64-598 SS2]
MAKGKSQKKHNRPANKYAAPPGDDPDKSAEQIKEEGNVAFKAQRYGDAIDLYSKAIDLAPHEAAYLTNRAAAYMALKRFRPALADCQSAATLQSTSTTGTSGAPPKTLLRLARCHLALGAPDPASAALRAALDTEPANAQAQALLDRVRELEAHLATFDGARARGEWALARLALDKCRQVVEREGGEVPLEWRLWKVDLELAKGNWDGASISANDALRYAPQSPEALTTRGLVLLLSGKLPQAKDHAASALRLDPAHAPAMHLRKRVREIERLKEEGNAAFKANRLDDALRMYDEALEHIGESDAEGRGGQIRATLLSNRATALSKLSRHEDAVLASSLALDLAPTFFKALRTRARAELALERFDEAVRDFGAALECAEAGAETRALKAELKKAEAALKRSKSKDYYKILGVGRECTEVEIKKAYRRESLKHHPDKGGDEEKFKLVVEAHAVLSDPQRRERYDLGEDEDGASSMGPGGADMDDIAQMFFQGGFGGGSAGAGGGNPFGGGGAGGFRFSTGGPHFQF